MDEKTIQARIKGERERCIANIAARTELPRQQWWLSFADVNGFRGCVVVHANGFTEALTGTSIPAGPQAAPVEADRDTLPEGCSCVVWRPVCLIKLKRKS